MLVRLYVSPGKSRISTDRVRHGCELILNGMTSQVLNSCLLAAAIGRYRASKILFHTVHTCAFATQSRHYSPQDKTLSKENYSVAFTSHEKPFTYLP